MLKIRRDGALSKAELGVAFHFPDYNSAYSFSELAETAVEEGQEKGTIGTGVSVKTKLDFSGNLRLEIGYSPTGPDGRLVSPEDTKTGQADLEILRQILEADLDSLSGYEKAAKERRALLDYSYPETAKKERTERELFSLPGKMEIDGGALLPPEKVGREIVLILPGKYDPSLARIPALETLAKDASRGTGKRERIDLFPKAPKKMGSLNRRSEKVENFIESWFFSLESEGKGAGYLEEDLARKAFAYSLEIEMFEAGLYDELGCYYVEARPVGDSIRLTVSGDPRKKQEIERRVSKVVDKVRESPRAGEWKIVRTYSKGAGSEEFEYYMPSNRLTRLGRSRGEGTNSGASRKTFAGAESEYSGLSLGEEIGRYSIVPSKKRGREKGKGRSGEIVKPPENFSEGPEARKGTYDEKELPPGKSLRKREYRHPNGTLIVETHSRLPGIIGAGVVFSGSGCVYGARDGSANLTHLQEHTKMRAKDGISNFQSDGIEEGVFFHAYTDADEMTFHFTASRRYRDALLDLAGRVFSGFKDKPSEYLLESEREGMKTELRSIGSETEPAERLANNISFGYERTLKEELETLDFVSPDDISRRNANFCSGNATIVGLNMGKKDLLRLAGGIRRGPAHKEEPWHMKGRRARERSHSSYPILIECAEIPAENEGAVRTFLEIANHNALKDKAGEGLGISSTYTRVGNVVEVQTQVSGSGGFGQVNRLYSEWVALRKKYSQEGFSEEDAKDAKRRIFSEINVSEDALSSFYGELSARGGKRRPPGKGLPGRGSIKELSWEEIQEGGKIYNSSRRRAVVEGRPY